MKNDLPPTETLDLTELEGEMLALVSGGTGPGLEPDGGP